MDPRLLDYYNRELQHLRETGGEFAEQFPKIAARLGLSSVECADPYVERLLEGFAFLAARVQLKIDAEFPRFTQHLLDMIYPHYLTPLPSMAVVRFEPDMSEAALADGFSLPRHTQLRSRLGKGEQTPCTYRTAHETVLWPIELTEAEYFSRDVASINVPQVAKVRAGLRLRFRSTAGLNFNEIKLDRLPIYLHGSDERPMRLYEQSLASLKAIVVRPADSRPEWQDILHRKNLVRCGYEDEQSLLPSGPRSFEGYRLLHEYCAFPQRFMFIELQNLKRSIRKCKQDELEIILLFSEPDQSLENTVTEENFSLFCTPAINLFPRRADRIHLDDKVPEFHILPDRTRPMDFEVFDVTQVTGHGTSADQEQEFLPFYAANDLGDARDHDAYFTLNRLPRMLSSNQRRYGQRSRNYIGSEVFIALVNSREGPFSHNLRQLSLETLCTNRDLPLQMPVGRSNTDFTMETAAPVEAVRCVAGPTRPKPSPTYESGEVAWRLINHLSLNYLTLTDTDQRQGASALRDLLGLYGDVADASMRKQIEGVRSVTSKPIVRPLPVPGPRTFGRGLELTITFDESYFEGTGIFLLGSVMEQFFAKYVSINSFTETVVSSTENGREEVIRWPARIGRRHTL